MDLTFLGATGTVTGSRYLVSTVTRDILVDCGLFQGLKQLRLRNRQRFPIHPCRLDAVVLTHAHLDHSGYLPALVRDGFRGPVLCTPETLELLEILLPDSGRLQEEEAEHANRHGYTRHHPAAPLYTERDAEVALRQVRPVPFDQEAELGGGVRMRLRVAGHILGAAMATVTAEGVEVLFSGDLGRPGDPLLPPPAPIGAVDYLVVESTYGDRMHPEVDPLERLAALVRETVGRGGALLIPSFAVGRAQQVLYLLHRLRAGGRIPEVPIYLDSPMARRATEVFRAHASALRLSRAEAEAACDVAEPVESVRESQAVDRMRFPRIIVSASGMATGGRVLHHLTALAPDARNTVLFTGHQAAGTRGASLVAGEPTVKIHGRHVPVRARVEVLESLSAHADRREILAWLQTAAAPPRQTFVTHGEPTASDALRREIQERLGWEVRVPEYRESYTLLPTAVESVAAAESAARRGAAAPVGVTA